MFRDPVRFAIAFIAFFLLFFSFAHRWKGEDGYGWEATVDGDAKGYYAPLPAVLIYHDPTFEFFSRPENESVARYYNERFRVRSDAGTVHKNYAGVAVMQLPFFMAGHGLALLTNEPVNGYSWPYMLMLILGSVTYCVAGLCMVAHLLIGFGISGRVTAIVLLLVSLSTNLLYYTAIHAAMPHVYSFFLIACFAYLMRNFFLHHRSRMLFAASFVFGLIVLVRPVNALVLAALPFLAPSSAVLFHSIGWLRQRIGTVLLTMIPALLIISIQLLFYKVQTGNWFVWSYGDEGFRFDDPHVWDVLFSWKKGFFVYTPIMLFSFAGIGVMVRSNRWAGGMYLLFIVLTLYVISSWWSWFYGDGFGLRAFVDYYPLMAVPLAFAVNGLFKLNFKISLSLLLLLPLFLLLSVVQNYQYRYRIIHPAEMNFDKYRYVFLKTDASYRDVIGGDNEYIYPRLSEQPAASWFNDFENSVAGWNGEGGKDSQQPFSGKRTDQFHSEREWGTTLTVTGRDLPNASGNLFAVVTYQRYQHEPGACNQVYLACAVDDSTDKNISWKGFRSNEYPIETTGKWMSAEARFRLPENIGASDRLKIYIWNKEKRMFEVDDLRVEVYEIIN